MEKIQAVSLKIVEHIHKQPEEDDGAAVVVGSVAPSVKSGSRGKRQSVKCVRLGLTDEEV